MVQEFKDFISQGGVISIAVGLVLAAAFGLVINSFVNDILMQIIAGIFGESDFRSLSFDLGDGQVRYGSFINTLVNFASVAAALFFMLKMLGKIPVEPEED